MNTFSNRPSEMGYMSLENEMKRLALMVCAIKQLANACQEGNIQLSLKEVKLIEGVGYDIFYTAKHFELNQNKFEADVAALAIQMLEDGTYKKANEKFKEENPEKIKEMKKQFKEERKKEQLENIFIGNVPAYNHSKTKH